MKWHMDAKNVALGAVLGAGLCLLIAAVGSELPGPVGRYQACCGQNTAYLVDTVTGQVWLNSEREFRAPKLRAEAVSVPPTDRATAVRPRTIQPPAAEPRVRTGPADVTGKWILTHPTLGQLTIQIEPDGRAVLNEGDKNWEGKWRAEGDQITITTERESLTARLDDQGRLLVREGNSDPIAFQRAQ